MTEKMNIEVPIPNDWSGIQARIVWEFLESIMDAIWNVHGDHIQEAIEREESILRNAARGEPTPSDDFPF